MALHFLDHPLRAPVIPLCDLGILTGPVVPRLHIIARPGTRSFAMSAIDGSPL